MLEQPWFLKHGLIGGLSLGLPRPTVAQLVADVGEFHLRLNLALTHHRPLDQEELLRSWLPERAERFIEVMREQKATVGFHEAQVLNLIRLVILHSHDAGRRCDTMGNFTMLARILLQVTDILVERDAAAEPDRRAWVFGNFTRSKLFMHDEPRVPDAMARNYDLFVLVPRLLKRGGLAYYLPGTFEQVMGGLAIEDIGLGFGLLSQYDTIGADVMGHADIGINRETYLANVHTAAAARDRLWPLVSKPLEKYRQALQREWDRTTGVARWAAMTTSTQFTHGIYWILANGVPAGQRQAFTNFFGHVFEAYVTRCPRWYPRACKVRQKDASLCRG